jgi:hypothetical protein
MRDWIAGAMAVLGTLLVLSGGAVIVLKALGIGTSPGAEQSEETPSYLTSGRGRLGNALHRMSSADRLIGWGIVLLVIAAVAAGAIAFNVEAGTR